MHDEEDYEDDDEEYEDYEDDDEEYDDDEEEEDLDDDECDDDVEEDDDDECDDDDEEEDYEDECEEIEEAVVAMMVGDVCEAEESPLRATVNEYQLPTDVGDITMIPDAGLEPAVNQTTEVESQPDLLDPVSKAIDQPMDGSERDETQDTGNVPVGDPTDGPRSKDSTQMSSTSFDKPPFMQGKKFSLAMAILAAVGLLDALEVVNTVSRVPKVFGYNRPVGDGSDGYTAYSDYTLAQAEYDAIKEQCEGVESKFQKEPPTVIALQGALASVRRLDEATAKLKIAKEHFLNQLTIRNRGEEKRMILAAAERLYVPPTGTIIADRQPETKVVATAKKN